jgi:HEAT repeat protein
MGSFDGGYQKLAEILQVESDHNLLDVIGMILAGVDGEVAPIDEILTLLKRENPYVRNLAITILQDYGNAIKYYIVKYLIGDDRDLRIFAINVLGDVEFSESRDMLVELLESEKDVNVAMTAVDYLGEIGLEEDISLLESLKRRFPDEFYVSFAVDSAINAIKG